jgi:hypothetical protein
MQKTLNLNKAEAPVDVPAILEWAAEAFQQEGQPWPQIARVLEEAARQCDEIIEKYKRREKWKKRDMRFG